MQVWRDEKGRFHMLFNANSDHSNCPATIPCGGHAWSRDGLSWSKPHIPAFGTIVHFEDNTTQIFDYVERPQISQDDDGKPLALFVGHGYGGVHNLAITEPDTDLVLNLGELVRGQGSTTGLG